MSDLEVVNNAKNKAIRRAEIAEKHIVELEKEKCELLGIIQGKDKAIQDLEKENKILAQNLEDTEIINKALEKENAELKKRNAEIRGMYVHSAREAGTYKQFFEAKEKENAELKEKLNKIERKCKFNFVDLLHDVEKETKAREIIREYSKWECEYCDYKRNPDYVTMHCSQCQKYPLHKKAEQFLNSEVEK